MTTRAYTLQDPRMPGALDVPRRSTPDGSVAAEPAVVRGAREEDDAFLAATLAPCAVLVNAQMEITRIRGDVAPFIALEPGDASLDLFGLIRHQEVLAILRPALRRAFRNRVTVAKDNVLVVEGDVRLSISFEIIPYGGSPSAGDRCWVVFHSRPAPVKRKGESAGARTEIDGLRHALAAAIEDRQLLADEAAAAAEEARARDEGLRSKNDELETARKELQSAVLVAEEAARSATMLSEASALLAASLDYETTLESLTRLSTAAFADWCAVDLVNDDGSIRHLTVSHANPVMRDLAQQFQEVVFAEPEHAPGAPQALLLRKSVLLTDLAHSHVTGIQPEAKIKQLIGALGVRSLISVPLIVRDKVLGTTTFSSSRRVYDEVDLQLAEELSQRAAVAVDTAMLFRDAESANRYKDAFLGTVAHELRTPLTSIVGWVQLAKSSPHMNREALMRVDESASLLRLFIEDLLDVTRIRQQKLSVDMAEMDWVTVIRSALEMTALSANARDIQITLDLRLDPAPLQGDGVRLRQVVWNLLSNAIKFTPPGGQIEVRLDRYGNDARLSVCDSGAGISADFVPHVFELYRQDARTAGQMPGLGIGLAIVAQIVKLHGGTVRVESAGLGHGSTFIVSLPLFPVPAKDASDSGNQRRNGRSQRAESRRAAHLSSEESS